jgi:hypothetical protein
VNDRAYFQVLYDTAKDSMMEAFYAAAVRERNNGHLGDCQHPSEVQSHRSERSEGTTYYATECTSCGAVFNIGMQESW